MKNYNSKLLGWLFVFSLLAPIVSCAESEPIHGFNLIDNSGTGGVTATGGDTGTGGYDNTGGYTSTGGYLGTGGTATGGYPGTGGTATGGYPGTGGVVATGGVGGRVGSAGRSGGAAGRSGGGGAAGGASGNATFAFVMSTITANCEGSNCHNGTQSVKFVSTVAATLYSNLTTMKAPDCMNVPLVTPGDPTMSALYLAITKMCGGNVPQMPDGKAALPMATITAIQTWITNGASQN